MAHRWCILHLNIQWLWDQSALGRRTRNSFWRNYLMASIELTDNGVLSTRDPDIQELNEYSACGLLLRWNYTEYADFGVKCFRSSALYNLPWAHWGSFITLPASLWLSCLFILGITRTIQCILQWFSYCTKSPILSVKVVKNYISTKNLRAYSLCN